MGLRNVDIKALSKVPPFRKMAVGTWANPSDPQIYGIMEVDLTKAYAWRDKLPEDGPKVTVTHMIARAIGLAMARYPDLNGFIRFRKIYLRQSVDAFFQVAVKHESGREDLTGVRLSRLDEKSVVEIAENMAAKIERTRVHKDTDAQKTQQMMSYVPGFLMGFILWFTSFVSYFLNIRFPGVPKDPFGGAMITNVGSLGMDVAFAPLVPYSKTPLIILVGQAKPRPVVIDGEVVVREVVTLNATIDHRFCDGALLAKMVKVIDETFDNPEEHFG